MLEIMTVVLLVVFVVGMAANIAVFVAGCRQRRNNALVCGVGVLVVCGLFALGIWSIFRQPLRASLALWWTLTFLWILFTRVHAKSVAGSILLDCGPHPRRWLFLLCAALFLFLLGNGEGSFARLFDSHRIAEAVASICFSAFWLVLASDRLQIRENGIWVHLSLLKWDKLEDYRWKGNLVLLRAKSRIPLLGPTALAVPAKHKDSVDALLRKHMRPTH